MFLSTVCVSPCSLSYYSLEVEWEVWEGTLGVLVRYLRTTKVVYLVNGSESSGTDSPGSGCPG